MKKVWIAAFVVVAILCLVASIIYFTNTAGNLPSFFPGYTKGSSHTHTKHGIALAGVAAVCLIGAWILSGDQSKHKLDKGAPEK
ncbi:MAG TPA: hypothetical protein VL989_00180 [Candidatus Sulfotelmatobacter sp.]|nr:hypothetical protein [Candidatus Sulfotelmatobacter sp.]